MSLEAAWPRLGWDERTRTLRELWEKAATVHTVDPSLVAPHVRPHSAFLRPDPEAVAQVRQLEGLGVLGAAPRAVLLAALDRFWPACPTGQVSPRTALTCGPRW